MKKLMIAVAAIAVGVTAQAKSAKNLDAQVYDFSATVKSTACKEVKVTKTIATLEGVDYATVKGQKIATRKQASTKIAGVIWGCECETIANPQWRLYNGGSTIGGYLFWNASAKEVFNIFTTTFAWAVFNRIDDGNKAEGVWALVNNDARNVVGFLGAGFGKVSGTNCRTILSSMSGNFAGFLLAGSDASGCKFCGGIACDAWQICPCTPAFYDTDLTAAYGSWKIKYNKTASNKLRKTGLITESYSFKKAGDAEILLLKVEAAAAAGTLATDADLWDAYNALHEEDEEEGWDGEEFGEQVTKEQVGAKAYAVGDDDAEAPETYDGENKLVEVLLSLADADAS
jgi:hypothetical protein